MSEVVTAKVSRDLRDRARKYGVNISGLVRKALEAEVERLEEQELRKQIDKVSLSVRKQLSQQDVVEAIRETREER